MTAVDPTVNLLSLVAGAVMGWVFARTLECPKLEAPVRLGVAFGDARVYYCGCECQD